MANDLADRISEGAVAVLELVPDEQRFADLSRHVLKGGASRFSPVVLDDEAIRYVLPVGVPGKKLDFGTLLIQRSRCALVWRTDPTRPYHAMVTELGPETIIKQSPATVRGDVWGRFDLRHPGAANMTFLVPPVATPALPRMLHRVLIEEPRAQQGRFETTPLPVEITEGIKKVADGPKPAPAPAGSAVGGGGAAAPALDPTQVLPAVKAGAAPPEQGPTPAAPVLDPTQVIPAVKDVPVPAPAPRVTATPTEVLPASPTVNAPTEVLPNVAPAAEPDVDRTEVLGASEGLYRDGGRTAPFDRPSGYSPAPTLASTSQPTASETTARQPAVSAASTNPAGSTWTPQAPARPANPVPPPTAVREPVRDVVPANQGGFGRWLRDVLPGFGIGLLVTLVIGGLVILAKYMGWLG